MAARASAGASSLAVSRGRHFRRSCHRRRFILSVRLQASRRVARVKTTYLHKNYKISHKTTISAKTARSLCRLYRFLRRYPTRDMGKTRVALDAPGVGIEIETDGFKASPSLARAAATPVLKSANSAAPLSELRPLADVYVAQEEAKAASRALSRR